MDERRSSEHDALESLLGSLLSPEPGALPVSEIRRRIAAAQVAAEESSEAASVELEGLGWTWQVPREPGQHRFEIPAAIAEAAGVSPEGVVDVAGALRVVLVPTGRTTDLQVLLGGDGRWQRRDLERAAGQLVAEFETWPQAPELVLQTADRLVGDVDWLVLELLLAEDQLLFRSGGQRTTYDVAPVHVAPGGTLHGALHVGVGEAELELFGDVPAGNWVARLLAGADAVEVALRPGDRGGLYALVRVAWLRPDTPPKLQIRLSST